MTHSLEKNEIQLLFEQYYVSLVEFSWRIVQCDETARDLVQDIFVKLLETSQSLQKNNGAQKSYLYTAVKNASLNHLRRTKVVDKYMDVNYFDEMDDRLLLDALIHAELVGHLHKAVNSLPTACQEICKLSYLDEKSNLEIAAHCNVSINTVKTHKQRAIKLLRQHLLPIYRTAKFIFPFFF